MDALQCMGAIRMRVQTADKNTTLTHPSVNVLWREKLLFGRNPTLRHFELQAVVSSFKYAYYFKYKKDQGKNVTLQLEVSTL